MIRLMIKTHVKTGLKYLCMTRKENWQEYKGSGKLWERHLKKHGNEITTELLLETENEDTFKTVAKQKSMELDVANSADWANLRPEEGDGGDTVSKKKWITNGKDEKYTDDIIPEGWRYGRSDRCVFKNKEKQSEFAKRSDPVKRGKGIKRAWDSGNFNRDHSKCGTKGDDNPSKRPEVREKQSKKALERWSNVEIEERRKYMKRARDIRWKK